MEFLVFSFQIPKTSVGVGRGGEIERGDGGKKERVGGHSLRRRRAHFLRWWRRRPVTSLLDLQPIVGTANDDGDVVCCDLLQMGWLSFLISFGSRTNYCKFVKSFPCFGYLYNFLFPLGVQKPFTGCPFLLVAALYFPCHFEYLVKFLLVHCLDFLLPTAILLRVGLYLVSFVISTLKLNGWLTNLVFSQLKEYPISLNCYKDIYP